MLQPAAAIDARLLQLQTSKNESGLNALLDSLYGSVNTSTWQASVASLVKRIEGAHEVVKDGPVAFR